VVVGEDQTLVREGIVRMLEHAGFDVVGAAADAERLVGMAQALHPAVVLTDIQMPPDHTDDGLRAALRLRRTDPAVGVILLTQFLDGQYAADLLADRAEGVGYLLKEKVSNADVLADAIRRVAAGGTALDPDVVAALVGRKRVGQPLDALTPRERDVLALMAEGHSNSGIARIQFVTIAAVERHITGIFSKLGLQQDSAVQHRRVLAVLRYLQS
jgi:DNA-binding NarL/FixJ family response regulator